MPGTEKMKHVSLTLQVENDLKHQLSIGALKPGARLITKNLAEQLGMSITPVREALLRLVSVNALSVAPAQAFTVPEVGKRQLDEINRIRYELELMAVTLAVENLTRKTWRNSRNCSRNYSRRKKRATWNKSLMRTGYFA